MSIDLNWETLTSGPDGDALAERIRSFVHDRFQTVPLPRFIRSVAVHGFDFGTIPPQLELKDITDPLPDFYDQELDEDEDEDDDDEGSNGGEHHQHQDASHQQTTKDGPRATAGAGASAGSSGRAKSRPGALRTVLRNEIIGHHDLGSPFLGTSTPGILGGPGLNYFQGHLGGTGTHTPLAAVAGAHLGNSWLGPMSEQEVQAASHSRQPSQSSISVDNLSFIDQSPNLREKSSVSTLAPTSVGTSRPPTRDTLLTGSAVSEGDDDEGGGGGGGQETESPLGQGPDDAAHHRKEPRVDDVQAVFRIRYAGDVRLNLTAEILLDYPMPSFVGIPLKLNVAGLSFDGVGVLANIRKRVHFCFLSPEDALTAVGPDEESDGAGEEQGATPEQHQSQSQKPKTRLGGLLQEIKVESEIGERDGGKQSLKNVGKVERFVLEQVRRIFEEEFVYPSFWTFLV